jgi:hypothetical protein
MENTEGQASELFIHDGGECVCLTHAPESLKYALEQDHGREVWTYRGTWERFPAAELWAENVECETCVPLSLQFAKREA